MENLIKKIWDFLKSRSPYVIVIAILILIIFLQKSCGHKCPEQKVLYKTDTITKYDTTLIIRTEYTPKWITRYEYIFEPEFFFTPVDSAAILKEFLASYIYQDTLLNDSTAFIYIRDSITRNQMVSRSWEYKDRTPTQIITNTTMIDAGLKWNMGIGGFVGGNLNRFDAGVGLVLSTKNHGLYQVEYCFFDKSFRVGMYWNLRKQRHENKN